MFTTVCMQAALLRGLLMKPMSGPKPTYNMMRTLSATEVRAVLRAQGLPVDGAAAETRKRVRIFSWVVSTRVPMPRRPAPQLLPTLCTRSY